jgi:hypothetical protein
MNLLVLAGTHKFCFLRDKVYENRVLDKIGLMLSRLEIFILIMMHKNVPFLYHTNALKSMTHVAFVRVSSLMNGKLINAFECLISLSFCIMGFPYHVFL